MMNDHKYSLLLSGGMSGGGGGGGGGEDESRVPPSVVALDEILGRFAWQRLLKNVNFMKRYFLAEDDFYPDPDWRAITLDHRLVAVSVRKPGVRVDTPAGPLTTGTRWVPLYSCEFENVSDSKTSHKFRGKRETTTWVAVDLTSCYTIKGEVTLDVTLPSNFLKCSAGRNSGLTLNKMHGQILKEVVSWEVDSMVDLPPHHKAMAQLQALEECQVLDLDVHTVLTVPSGILPVFFRKKTDDKVAHTVLLNDWEQAFQSREDGGLVDGKLSKLVQPMWERAVDSQGKESSKVSVHLVTKGTASCLAWSDQRVDMRTEPVTSISVDQHAFYNGNVTLDANV